MKKILLLGGSAQQIIAIETAKRLGYYTILCDYLEDNPGQFIADKFYLKSTTDKETILEIAEQEKIDGVLAYASDPAAPTAAYIAEKMGLPGNPYKSVEILCNKDKFRKFLKENNFNTPKSVHIKNVKNNPNIGNSMKFPVIIKPVDSSGSKGITVLENIKDLPQAMEYAMKFSRSHKIIIEEFVQKKHLYLIGGDLLIYNGEIILWGLLNCHRDQRVNPLVPVGKSYPLALGKEDIIRVKKVLENIVNLLQINNGAMNVELIIDKDNNVWPIDIGPRSGGNMIPDLLGNIFQINLVEMIVKIAMGEKLEGEIGEGKGFFATHNLHAIKSGVLDKILFSEKIQPYIIKKVIYKKEGEYIDFFDNASKALGIVFFKFNNKEEMRYILSNISDYIKVQYNTGEVL